MDNKEKDDLLKNLEPSYFHIDIDDIIERLKKSASQLKNDSFPLSEKEINGLCYKTRKCFIRQPVLLEINPPVNICGDIHGQFDDLMDIFLKVGEPEKENYLFLGDYVDRGKKSLETICLLFCYKIKYTDNFFLLRGNHECSQVNKMYGFFDECKQKLSIKVWKIFSNCFNYLPLAAVIG